MYCKIKNRNIIKSLIILLVGEESYGKTVFRYRRSKFYLSENFPAHSDPVSIKRKQISSVLNFSSIKPTRKKRRGKYTKYRCKCRENFRLYILWYGETESRRTFLFELVPGLRVNFSHTTKKQQVNRMKTGYFFIILSG